MTREQAFGFASVRLDVGSSRMTRRAVQRQRLGDLHQSALGERQIGDTGVSGGKSHRAALENGATSARIFGLVDQLEHARRTAARAR